MPRVYREPCIFKIASPTSFLRRPLIGNREVWNGIKSEPNKVEINRLSLQ